MNHDHDVDKFIMSPYKDIYGQMNWSNSYVDSLSRINLRYSFPADSNVADNKNPDHFACDTTSRSETMDTINTKSDWFYAWCIRIKIEYSFFAAACI